ncbi:hypothetical protein BC936DRAFT_138707 [Jimgerdemannia flammicorona]|uniref:Uncharacterized protein n=1 Tax=Jimgerdemannia flammicorona TaxID=994334 RepID=A0A433DI69_9FUNG|nr:hypothetical protein BC936DRAFT_138707 [Jimgerdemannia flammicorona]
MPNYPAALPRRRPCPTPRTLWLFGPGPVFSLLFVPSRNPPPAHEYQPATCIQETLPRRRLRMPPPQGRPRTNTELSPRALEVVRGVSLREGAKQQLYYPEIVRAIEHTNQISAVFSRERGVLPREGAEQQPYGMELVCSFSPPGVKIQNAPVYGEKTHAPEAVRGVSSREETKQKPSPPARFYHLVPLAGHRCAPFCRGLRGFSPVLSSAWLDRDHSEDV